MGLSCLSAEDISVVTIGSGRPWEIFFFVSEISAASGKKHFNEAYGSVLYAYRTLGFACAKAILAQHLGLQGATAASRFVVVRVAGQPSGAALLSEVDASDGTRVLVIDFLVVTPAARRHGVGRILVEYAQRHAPAGGVGCYCTPSSRAMQRLLKRLGFVRINRSRDVVVKGGPISVPSRWLWLRDR